MVEWARGGYERTFNQSAANSKKEPRVVTHFSTGVCSTIPSL